MPVLLAFSPLDLSCVLSPVRVQRLLVSAVCIGGEVLRLSTMRFLTVQPPIAALIRNFRAIGLASLRGPAFSAEALTLSPSLFKELAKRRLIKKQQRSNGNPLYDLPSRPLEAEKKNLYRKHSAVGKQRCLKQTERDQSPRIGGTNKKDDKITCECCDRRAENCSSAIPPFLSCSSTYTPPGENGWCRIF